MAIQRWSWERAKVLRHDEYIKRGHTGFFFVYLQHGGRLGRYRYYDMDKENRAALDDLKKL